MANFRTHLSVATLISGMATTTVASIGLVNVHQTPVLFALGVLGGLLPDIDADHSTPVRLAFSLLGLVAAFTAVFYALAHYHFSIGELCLLAGGTFALVRYVIFELFLRLTEHRGVFHSLLAVVFFTCLATSLSHNLMLSPPRLAWLHGLMVGLGYLVHLGLDELFSVDLLGGRLKRSFGSALKPFGSDLKATLVMGALLVAIGPTLPNGQALASILSEKSLVQPLRARLWPPEGQWFAPWWNLHPRVNRLD